MSHQETGVRWMLAREEATARLCRGGVLADDMGLGKTFQTIGLLRNSPMQSWRTLILCPPALVAAWNEELVACGYYVSVLAPGGGSWSKQTVIRRQTVWLSTYPRTPHIADGLRREAWPVWERVILDEGHCIRNGYGTVRGSACAAIGYAATVRWILSATPIQNSARDWRVLCDWLHVPSTPADREDAAEVLMLRRTMAELRHIIAALPPPPHFVIRHLTMPSAGAEQRLFRVLCDRIENIIDTHHVSAMDKLELWIRIQQFIVHPQIYVEAMRAKFRLKDYPRPDWRGTATKWQACMEDLAASVREGVPTIVFCQFRAEMDHVEAAARQIGASVWSVRGGMDSEAVGAAVAAGREAAADGKESVVFVVQIVAGGVGLNLQFCRRVLFLSQHWNPAVVHQAVGRAVRIGQRGMVEVVMYRIVDDVLHNLDQRMQELHHEKIRGARKIAGSLYVW